MDALLKIVQLFPIVLACAVAIVAFVLGAKPKEKGKRLRDVLRGEPFLLSPVIVASLITSFVAAIAIIVRPISGNVSFATPLGIVLSTPTTTSTPYGTPGVPVAGVFIPYTVTPSPTPTNTPTVTPTNIATPTHTPSPTSSDTPTLTPTILTEVPTSTPTHTPSPRAQTPSQATPTDTPVSLTRMCSSFARIDLPTRNTSYSNDFAVVGNAYLSGDLSRRFDGYQVWLSQLNRTDHALEWFLIIDSKQAVVGNELATISLASLKRQGRPSGRYAIKLRVVDNTGNYDTDAYPDCITEVRIDLPDD